MTPITEESLERESWQSSENSMFFSKVLQNNPQNEEAEPVEIRISPASHPLDQVLLDTYNAQHSTDLHLNYIDADAWDVSLIQSKGPREFDPLGEGIGDDTVLLTCGSFKTMEAVNNLITALRGDL